MTRQKITITERAAGLLPFILMLGLTAEAKTYNAPSPSYADVNNYCHNVASPGDTVVMPAGSATWLQPLWLPLGVSLVGSGTNSTIITDGSILSGNALINAVNTADGSHVSLSAQYPTRISNFQILGAGNTSFGFSDSVITIGSGVDNQPIQWRIDHIFFNQCVSHQIVVWNKLGLIDHCFFLMNSPNTGLQAVRVFGDLQSCGNYSWSIPYYYGTTNSLYVEANVFDNITTNSSNGVICDIPEGGGMVFRYNTVINSFWANHGTETYRSCRWWEIYNNTFLAINNTFMEDLYAMDFRGGTGVVFSNTITGYRMAESTENYRSTTYFAGLGGDNGVNPLDINSGTVFLSGTWTGSSTICNNNELTFTGVSWTPNQWAGYTLVDTTASAYDQYGFPALAFALIVSNDNQKLTFYPPKYSGGAIPYFKITQGDRWQIGKVIRALDQIGSGSGSLMSFGGPGGVQLSGANTQTTETLYWWGNTLNGANCHFSNNGNPTIVPGRDFTNDVAKPGYLPLVYPHPLQGESSAQDGITNPVPAVNLTPPTGLSAH